MDFSLDTLKKTTGLTKLQKSGGYSLDKLKTSTSSNAGLTNLDSRINNLSKHALSKAAIALKETQAEIVFLFDSSGSCEGLEEPTIHSFNNFIREERAKGYPTKVTTVLFSNLEYVIHDRIDIDKVSSFSYRADGGTALYDTICNRIYATMNHQANSGISNMKTLFVIMTDGDDRHSRYYDVNKTRELIKNRQAAGWEFIFLGAKIDAKYHAQRLGIKEQNAENYLESREGLALNFKGVQKALEGMRIDGKIDPNWAKDIKINTARQNNRQLGTGSTGDKTLRLGR